MFGNNELRKQEITDGNALELVEMFPTIQGEGPLAGTPAFFIRLAGCNLNCKFCDTEFEDDAVVMSIDDIIFHALESGLHSAVITGGEPFRQNIVPLVLRLIQNGFHVSIETAGTLWLYKWDEVPVENYTLVCSPKTGSINATLLDYISAWKYIIKNGEVAKADGLPCVLPCTGKVGNVRRPTGGAEIFVQPCDEHNEHLNALNNAATVSSALKFGYRISFQMHKALNLR